MKSLVSFFLVCLPLKHLEINSAYGYRIHPLTGKYALHAGVDLKARHDTVSAILDGHVKATGYDNGLGRYVRLQHGGLESIYGHLSRVFVCTGDSLNAGEPIGITGATGRVTGEHLHFSISYRHYDLHPIKFLYKLLKNQNHEQKFQSASRPAFR